MADEKRVREAEEMRNAGQGDLAATHLIEGLIDEDDGSTFPEEDRQPEEAPEITDEDEAEDDASEPESEEEADVEEDVEDLDEETSDEPARLDISDEALDALVTVKVNGEEQEVPLREALDGYQRQKAFTLKTQELAEQRKALEAEFEAGRETRQQTLERLDELESVLSALSPQELTVEQIQQMDPEQVKRYQEFNETLEATREEREKLAEQQAKEAELALARKQNERDEALMAAIPGWSDLDTARSEMEELVEYAQDEFGYSLDYIAQTVDPNAFIMLRKAKLYDELESKGKEVRKKAKKSLTLKPGSTSEKKTSSEDKKLAAAKSRLSKTGSVRDGAKVLELMGID